MLITKVAIKWKSSVFLMMIVFIIFGSLLFGILSMYLVELISKAVIPPPTPKMIRPLRKIINILLIGIVLLTKKRINNSIIIALAAVAPSKAINIPI